jgi:lipoprotein NlpI
MIDLDGFSRRQSMSGRGRRALAGAAITLAAMMFVSSAIAQSTDDWKCTSMRPNIPIDERISSCNSVIALEKYGWMNKSRAYLARANAYLTKGEFDGAIADLTEVIKLYPDSPYAYYNRASAYLKKGDYDRAIVDYSELIRRNQQDAHAFFGRGVAYLRNGEPDHAIADYNRLIELNPKNARAYRSRAIANLYTGSVSKSLADLDQSADLDPKDAYVALWRDVVAKRSNMPSRLAAATGQLDMTKWPAPIVHLFLGETTAEAVLAATDDPDGEKKTGQICEANFYTGALALRRGDEKDARRLFQLAATECPKGFVEWQAANAELKAMGITP